MKIKLYILTILIVSSFIVKAQNDATASPGKPSFGIYGGINFQNINGKDDAGTKLANSLVTRFTLGINEEIPLAPEFYFQAGLQFISKGSKGQVAYQNVSGTHLITRTINMNYIEMPLNFVFKPLLGTGHWVLGFGPYIGYCIGGKAKFSGTSAPSDADIVFEKNVPVNDQNNLVYFKHLDVGANFFTGYEMESGLNIILNSQLGLININSKTTTKLAEKNTGFGLSLGYRF